jgi:hypothetical protein
MNVYIGDTPEQLGSYRTADAIIVGDKVVTKADYLALVAQVELLAGHRHELLDLVYNNAIGQVAMGYAIDGELMAEHAYEITGIDATSVTNSLPPTTQCLKQIQAEAGSAGYYNGFKDALIIEPPLPPATGTSATVDVFQYRIEQASRYAANQYANRIRQGGE